jgi:HlyD family secretion protein
MFMDRQIPKHVKQAQRKRAIIRILYVIIPLIALIFFISRWTEKTLSLDSLPTGQVDRGDIEISVSATGKLTPLEEEIVISPVGSRVLEVYKNPGDTVMEGEPLMKLDLTSVQTDYDQMLDERAMMKSRLVQAEVSLDNTISDMNMQRQLKKMALDQLESDYNNELYLDSLGASTGEKVRQVKLRYEEAKLQMQQLDQKVVNERKSTEAAKKIQQLELAVFDKKLEEKARLLRDARVLSPKTAVLTFILNQIGAQVGSGTELAIVADVSRYKVECEIPDGHREKVAPGSRAIVTISELRLPGVVTTVTPSVLNGIIKFTVLLDEAGHSGLRSGLSAQVNVLYGLQSGVVRIPNGKYFGYGRGDYNLWVIEGRKAVKRRVKLGESGFEYVEVIEGLSPGEYVILDEMERFGNKSEIKIKQ